MIAIRVRYYSCLHSPSWCNPSSSSPLLSHRLTYLVWWLVGCCWAADRHTSLNLFFPVLVQSNSYFANIARTNEQYSDIRKTNRHVSSILRSFFYVCTNVRSSMYDEHVSLCMPVGQRGEHTCISRSLGHSVTNAGGGGEYTALTDDVKFLPTRKTFTLIDSMKWRIFKCSTEEKKKMKGDGRGEKKKWRIFIHVIHLIVVWCTWI